MAQRARPAIRLWVLLYQRLGKSLHCRAAGHISARAPAPAVAHHSQSSMLIQPFHPVAVLIVIPHGSYVRNAP